MEIVLADKVELWSGLKTREGEGEREVTSLQDVGSHFYERTV